MSGSHANGEQIGVWSMLSAKLAAVTIAERAKAAHMLLSHQSGIDRCVRTADSADTLCFLVPYLAFLQEKEVWDSRWRLGGIFTCNIIILPPVYALKSSYFVLVEWEDLWRDE